MGMCAVVLVRLVYVYVRRYTLVRALEAFWRKRFVNMHKKILEDQCVSDVCLAR